jgi:rhamnose utilization protein RhaD (predicted bifunctional aldolase and dehydrogenase)
VIFLGPAANRPAAKLRLLPEAGAVLAAGTEASADELALCLALVLERVPAAACLRYLSEADEAELMNWDAEQYRQALARSLGR